MPFLEISAQYKIRRYAVATLPRFDGVCTSRFPGSTGVGVSVWVRLSYGLGEGEDGEREVSLDPSINYQRQAQGSGRNHVIAIIILES